MSNFPSLLQNNTMVISDKYKMISTKSDENVFFSVTGQLVLGVGMYLIPITPVAFRAAFMPIHVYSGLFLFTTVIAVALMGITEKLSYL